MFVKIYTDELYVTLRAKLEQAQNFEAKLQELVTAGTIADAEFLDEESLRPMQKCFALVGTDVRIECSVIRKWGRRPDPKKDMVSITINAAKHDGGVAGFLKATGLVLSDYGFIRQ
jgi:hypothetical protein